MKTLSQKIKSPQQSKPEEWEKLSMRDRIDKIGDADIIAIFDYLGEGSMTRDKAEKELQRIQMANIDLCIKETREETLKEVLPKKESESKCGTENGRLVARGMNIIREDIIGKAKSKWNIKL